MDKVTIKNNKIIRFEHQDIALFPVKANPPHLGHILTLLRLKDRYRKIMISILDVNLFIEPKEIIEILDKVLKYFPQKFYYNIHRQSLSNSDFKELTDKLDFDVVVSGNRKVLDNAIKCGLKADFIERTPYYKGEDIRRK